MWILLRIPMIFIIFYHLELCAQPKIVFLFVGAKFKYSCVQKNTWSSTLGPTNNIFVGPKCVYFWQDLQRVYTVSCIFNFGPQHFLWDSISYVSQDLQRTYVIFQFGPDPRLVFFLVPKSEYFWTQILSLGITNNYSCFCDS